MAYLQPHRLFTLTKDKMYQLRRKIQERRQSIFSRWYNKGIENNLTYQVHNSSVLTRLNLSQPKREYSSKGSGSNLHDVQLVDPYVLVEDDLKNIFNQIKQELRRNTNQDELYEVAAYYFDGQGKSIRPMLSIIMARAINYHMHKNCLLQTQHQVAMISEMIHSASLIHDDAIDLADIRRGKPSVNKLWNQIQVAFAGDFVIAVASMMIARLQNNHLTTILSRVITDLVQGEFMQLGSKEVEHQRFTHYLTKTYCKTGSLIANSLKAVAVLAGTEENILEIAYQYGRNVGLAFQLTDDLLDFISSSAVMGKPTATDLKLGLATAPVLFASEEFPELNCMIMRRFQETGDVEKSLELVLKSQGLEKTRFLAEKHCFEAVKLAGLIRESPYQRALIIMCDLVIDRMK